jgi:hypothetical protein
MISFGGLAGIFNLTTWVLAALLKQQDVEILPAYPELINEEGKKITASEGLFTIMQANFILFKLKKERFCKSQALHFVESTFAGLTLVEKDGAATIVYKY